jgi:hypothetical protein
MDIGDIVARIEQYADALGEQRQQIPPWQKDQLIFRLTIELTMRHIAFALKQGDPPTPPNWNL